MHCVHIEPLSLGWDQYVFMVIVLFVGDIGIDGKILLCKFSIEQRLLLGRE